MPPNLIVPPPKPITPGYQPPPEQLPVESFKPMAKAVKDVKPFSFSVPTRTDVGNRDEAMQRKASAMNQITGYDVVEFLQKLATNLPDLRNLPSLDLDADKVRKNLGMRDPARAEEKPGLRNKTIENLSQLMKKTKSEGGNKSSLRQMAETGSQEALMSRLKSGEATLY
jgi:uncharacterized protein YihD (DUF1040 family)